MEQEQREYQNFDMTLEECRLVLDAIDNVVVIDAQGRVKYMAQNLISVLEMMMSRPLPADIAGRAIQEVNPFSKLPEALRNGKPVENVFYLSGGGTNVARIKPLYQNGQLVGAVDYDLFSNRVDLQAFLELLVEYAEKGFISVEDTVGRLRLPRERERKAKYSVTDFIGESDAARALRSRIIGLSESDSTVMIQGPTGCGKEVAAHAIHSVSRRASRPMVEINCAAIPDTLVESELFGYEEGSFTGASRGGKAGKFELADRGTLFLDEVNSLPYHVQPKLLRVLQEKEVTRIGGRPRPVDIRVIAASNADLWKLVEEGKFRQDLYYRLNVIELKIPPLSQRREDIPLLAQYQLGRLRRRMVTSVKHISDEALALLMDYEWPGNVRELNNILERAVNQCGGDTIRPEHLGDFGPRPAREPAEDVDWSLDAPLEDVRCRAERNALRRALEKAGGNRTRAAALLKISRTSFYEKAEKYHLWENEQTYS